jgi:hypothetical protein
MGPDNRLGAISLMSRCSSACVPVLFWRSLLVGQKLAATDQPIPDSARAHRICLVDATCIRAPRGGSGMGWRRHLRFDLFRQSILSAEVRTYPVIRTERRDGRGKPEEGRGGIFQTEVKSEATKTGVSRASGATGSSMGESLELDRSGAPRRAVEFYFFDLESGCVGALRATPVVFLSNDDRRALHATPLRRHASFLVEIQNSTTLAHHASCLAMPRGLC